MRRSLKNRFLKGTQKDKSNLRPENLPQQLDALSLGASSTSVSGNVEATQIVATDKSVPLPSHKVSLSEQLWNRAYDTLKKDEPRLISAYQTLLSKEIQDDSSRDVITDDVVGRREQMLEIINKGLVRTEKEAAKKKSVTAAVQVANQIKDTIAAGLKPSPEAALIWTALTAALPLVLNASEQSEKNRKGIETVLLILKQHDLLSHQILFNHDAEDLRREHTVKLYRELLRFLINSACYHDRNRFEVIFRDSIKFDNWDEQIKDIKDAQASLRLFLDDVASLSKEDKECLAKLHLTTPCLDKERIEKRAGSLFRDCYKWILDHEAYRTWHDENERLLWIKGDPGKGKTMLICGIINELASKPLTSYFFCQATYDKNNTATTILRGLIWMLAEQNPYLIHHIKNETDRSSGTIYSDANSFYSLSKILRSVLCNVDGVTFIVDALDECGDGRNEFIDLVRETSNIYNIKWLISSRNWPSIEERLGNIPKVSLEIENSVEFAVQSYINLKVSHLSSQKGYNPELIAFLTEYLSQHAGGTFLWVALVCTSLQNAGKREARKLIKELPPTLDALYGRMLQNVTTDRDTLTLSRILATATCVYRPVSVLELSNIMELSNDDLESIIELIQECGSFLTIRDSTVEFVHLSAQEYIKKHLQLAIDAKPTHKEIYRCSLRAISRTLKRNIYELDDMCVEISDVVLPGNNPLTSITYCCLFWAQHLEKSDTIVSELPGNSSLSTFFEKDFLFWLEAMSLLEAVSRAIYSMHVLHSITKGLATSRLQEFISDARRFVLFFRTMLDCYPLQIYDSGLIFSPVHSLVRKAYSSMAPAWVTLALNPVESWSASITAFAADSEMDDTDNYFIKQDMLCAPTFVPNGERIALGTTNGRILLYDLITGSLHQTLDLSQSCDVYASDHLQILGLARHESTSDLVFTFSKRFETEDDRRTRVWPDAVPSMLGHWDIESSEIKVLRTFPGSCELSPSGRYVAYEESHGDELLLWYYDIKHDHVFSLHSISESVLDYTFGISGTTIAVGWQSGSIEVWDLEKRSCLGIIENQQWSSNERYMTLSQYGEILAISYYFEKSPSERKDKVKVFDTKTGQLLWSQNDIFHMGQELEWTYNFLEDVLVMVVNCCDSIKLYDAVTGAIIGKVEMLHELTAKPLQCNQQLALVSDNKVELLDMSMVTLDLSDSKTWYLTSEVQNKMFRIRVRDFKDNIENWEDNIEWYEDWNPNTSSIVWKSPVFTRSETIHRYVRLNDNYIVDRQHNMVVIFYFDGTSLQEYSTLEISDDARMRCAPNGFHIAFWQQDFTGIYDVQQQVMVTDSTTSKIFSQYDACRREIPLTRRIAPAIWTLEGERLFRQIDKGLLIWSRENGFKNVALETQGRIMLSPCGTWLACLAAETNNTASAALEDHDHKLQIWHVGTSEMRSVLNLKSERSYQSCVSEIVFLPGKEQILILGETIQLCSFSDCLGKKLFAVSSIPGYLSQPVRFTSPTDLETLAGVISLDHDKIKLGTVNDPWLGENWIYLDNCKALWLPQGYRHRYSSVQSDGQIAFTTDRGKIAILRFSLNRISEAEREAFYRTHKKATFWQGSAGR